LDSEILASLVRIERRLEILISLSIASSSQKAEARSRPRSPERMLQEFGLTQSEIAQIVGKTQSAVSQSLARDGRR
jgi:hypothetical protein